MAASIAMMVGGAILNATAFTGSVYLAKCLEGDNSADRLAEQRRHDKAIEAHNKEVSEWQKKRQQYKDWLEKRYVKIMKDKQNFEDIDKSLDLYAATHPDPKEIEYLRHKPVFKYTPSDRHKNNELLYVGLGGLAIGAAAGYFI